MKQNYLYSIHKFLTDLPLQFRERICEECAWSIPTFYRKMRLGERHDVNGKVIPPLSNAETDKIGEVLEEFKYIVDRFDLDDESN